MAKKMEDLKEKAPCGMTIHYTVNSDDMITYNDINGRGVQCESCEHCTWRAICQPKEAKKEISRKTYVEICNLIYDTMQAAGEKVEEICDTLARTDASPKSVLACDAVEDIKKYRKKFHEINYFVELIG